ncbi:hypothetical protein Desti_2899 [Desulfomonile tiedjei DSM 6799]|uniref:Uncharacterized protein n=1 Tax=Desulfomonile tiedjei (strain ATCC 49306 / DSM 6799 / DCB-1) TaxID=706587 RepID=I4C7M7_DESTA|nr:hypothetical protein Desti_2899 [Desulfomonile tiedjei DSM 6799]
MRPPRFMPRPCCLSKDSFNRIVLIAIDKNSDVYAMLQYKILVGDGVPRPESVSKIEISPRSWHEVLIIFTA